MQIWYAVRSLCRRCGAYCVRSGSWLEQFTRIPLTAAARVALAIVNRAVECGISVELLCVKNRWRDASLLLISLYELQLDLQFIAKDPSRASTWIDHSDEKAKPWSVSSQLREVYPDEHERKGEAEIYRRLSMAKHGNPAGGVLGFSLSASRDYLLLDQNTGDSPFVGSQLFLLGVCLRRVGESASKIWIAQTLNLGTYVEQLQDQERDLSKSLERQLIELHQDPRDLDDPSG